MELEPPRMTTLGLPGSRRRAVTFSTTRAACCPSLPSLPPPPRPSPSGCLNGMRACVCLCGSLSAGVGRSRRDLAPDFSPAAAPATATAAAALALEPAAPAAAPLSLGALAPVVPTADEAAPPPWAASTRRAVTGGRQGRVAAGGGGGGGVEEKAPPPWCVSFPSTPNVSSPPAATS